MQCVDCNRLHGRLREICRGESDLPDDKRQTYIARWLKSGMLQETDCSDGLVSIETPVDGGRRKKRRTGGRRRRHISPNARRKGKGGGGCCKRAVTFAKTMAAWAADGLKIASATEQAERRQICETCPLNSEGWCSACGCHINEKIKLRVSFCPTAKWFVGQPPRPVYGPRHLMMHIMPVTKNGMWQWNVEQLLQRIDIFDGRRAVAIVTPQPGCKYTLDTVAAVQNAFRDHRIDEWIVARNNPRLREGATWPQLLTAVSREPGVTFACHAMGVTHNMQHLKLPWTEIQWMTCLDDWTSVERALSQYSMAGPFKRYGHFAVGNNNRWHYSGTFYWFRNDDVFRSGKDWHTMDKRFFASESWPARLFRPEETACLFCDDTKDLYKQHVWDGRVYEEFEQWKAARTLS